MKHTNEKREKDMKHTVLYIVAMASCLLSGCSQEEMPAASAAASPAGGYFLQPGTVEVLTQEGEIATRATAGYTALTTANAQMGLFRKKSGTTYTTLQNVPYKYMQPSGQTKMGWWAIGGDVGTVWLHPTANADIAACYPYNASLSLASGEGVVNLTAAIRNATAPQDLWYNHLQANGVNCHKNISLVQAYCRVQLTFLIDKSVSYTSEPYLYYLKIEGGRASAGSTTDGIFSAATLNLYSGAYTRGTKEYTPVNVTANSYQITDAAGTTKAAFDLMMIPATLSAAVKLTIKTGGSSGAAKDMSVSIPAADFGGSLTAGKIYKVSVKIKGTDISEFSSVTTDWSPVTSTGNGTTVDGQKYFDFSAPVF